MKQIGDMSAEELAGLVCHALRQAGVTVTLTGGACVAIWSEGRYVSDGLRPAGDLQPMGSFPTAQAKLCV